jgi:hypothetical protein
MDESFFLGDMGLSLYASYAGSQGIPAASI